MLKTNNPGEKRVFFAAAAMAVIVASPSPVIKSVDAISMEGRVKVVMKDQEGKGLNAPFLAKASMQHCVILRTIAQKDYAL